MERKFVVAFDRNDQLPERREWLSEAWGDVPTTHFQSDESMLDSIFIDLKINKWELNAAWSSRQGLAPIIRIEILRDESLVEFVNNHASLICDEVDAKVLMVFELEGESMDVDFIILMRLVAALCGRGRCYQWAEKLEFLDEKALADLPSSVELKDMLITCQ
ncbi:hypothetical protein ASC74_26140 [Pseudomonas sp. Root329]|uniref:hypothetical protein n=1 Tax=Pseudomonas sp. Root329 TaxID=1736515 RepID=UPI0006F1E3B3|nr:hypothetical protein [Pseudomonas sp. Root329]KQV15875.1 hypothetical protein ASC74_26140 [Pseudomonas sp. Root329]